jgi:hypothetical protein
MRRCMLRRVNPTRLRRSCPELSPEKGLRTHEQILVSPDD